MNYKGKIIKSLKIANLLFFSPNFDLWCMIVVTHIFKNKWIAEKLFAYCKNFYETLHLTFAKKKIKSTPLVLCFHLKPSELKEDCKGLTSMASPYKRKVVSCIVRVLYTVWLLILLLWEEYLGSCYCVLQTESSSALLYGMISPKTNYHGHVFERALSPGSPTFCSKKTDLV